MTTKQTQIAVRIEDEIVDRIDAMIRHARTMWNEPTRSDIVRACILAGLPIVEEQARRVAGATGAAKPPDEPDADPVTFTASGLPVRKPTK